MLYVQYKVDLRRARHAQDPGEQTRQYRPCGVVRAPAQFRTTGRRRATLPCLPMPDAHIQPVIRAPTSSYTSAGVGGRVNAVDDAVSPLLLLTELVCSLLSGATPFVPTPTGDIAASEHTITKTLQRRRFGLPNSRHSSPCTPSFLHAPPRASMSPPELLLRAPEVAY